MTTLYGIANCDTCRKARKWLEAQSIEYRFHDLRKDGIDAAQIAGWLDRLGADRVLNRRGTTWRKLDEEARKRAVGPQLADLLAEQPTLVKRPVVENGPDLLIGFDETNWRKALG